MPTLYQILGVPENATPAFMKTAFRKLSMQYHPDRNPGNPAAEARFREVLEAYRILSDPDDRMRYDRQLAWSRMPPQQASNQQTQSQQRHHHTQQRQSAANPPPPAAPPPRPLPWKFMAASLAGLILFLLVYTCLAPNRICRCRTTSGRRLLPVSFR
ncbi:J domain-containing protein [Chitinophaga pollutisoli]|uniref:J domain-containing protein n=1 Tax=Chitinophaga pollutisoli TaxID=3133966 RepID=A0ABZ2YI84_9BACT